MKNQSYRQQRIILWSSVFIFFFIFSAITQHDLRALLPTAPPDSNWVNPTLLQQEVADCFGVDFQTNAGEDPPCQSYNNDLYESINYFHLTRADGANDADLIAFRAGTDSEYFYFEWDMVDDWDENHSDSHLFIVELDIDPLSENQRGDYYFAIYGKKEFEDNGSENWIDAFNSGGYESFRDGNNDVGGNNVTSPDGSGGQDGYETPVNKSSNQVFARVKDGNMQLAVLRSLVGLTSSPVNTRFRGWTSQSSSVPNDKLYWHDENNASDLNSFDIDNVAWTSGPTAVTLTTIGKSPEPMMATLTLRLLLLMAVTSLAIIISFSRVFGWSFRPHSKKS